MQIDEIRQMLIAVAHEMTRLNGPTPTYEQALEEASIMFSRFDEWGAGPCGTFTEYVALRCPQLSRVPGYYRWPGGQSEHWWLEDKSGMILDPTKDQFPTENGVYFPIRRRHL